MILGEGLWQLGFGLGAGLLGAFFVSRLLASFPDRRHAARSRDLHLMSLLLALVALVACWIPARRAMRMDPLVAIRYE